MTERSYAADNVAATEALRELADSLSEADCKVDLGEGWNVGMALAHLAYWDAFHVTRWQAAAASGELAPAHLADDVTHRMNEALVATWRALPGTSAADLAVDAADIADNYIADLEDDNIEAAIERDGRNWFERSPHRTEHIEQIRRALGRG